VTESCAGATSGAIFAVPGAEGVVGAYVNPDVSYIQGWLRVWRLLTLLSPPQGFVHQTITLGSLLHDHCVVLEGPQTLEHTWFPGYAWTVAR
jgi:hypothetical protein